MFMEGLNLNLLAILSGALLYMVYGGIYYSILLRKKEQSNHPAKYAAAVIVAFISSFITSLFVQSAGSAGVIEGALSGLIPGVLISIVYLKNTLFGLINKNAFLIAVGDHLIIFTLMGALHGYLH
jgi:hypothetical protein